MCSYVWVPGPRHVTTGGQSFPKCDPTPCSWVATWVPVLQLKELPARSPNAKTPPLLTGVIQ